MAIILRLQSLKRWNNELNDTIVAMHGMVCYGMETQW